MLGIRRIKPDLQLSVCRKITIKIIYGITKWQNAEGKELSPQYGSLGNSKVKCSFVKILV